MSNLSHKNLVNRIVSIVIFAPIFICAICWNSFSYFVAFLLIVILCMREFYRIAESNGIKANTYWGIFSGAFLYLFSFLYAQGIFGNKQIMLLAPLLGVMLILTLYEKKVANQFINVAYTLLGVLYIALPFSLLHSIAFRCSLYDYKIVLCILIINWTNDTGAYIVGSICGNKKLFERISHKKSWEGTLGGGVLALTACFVLSKFYNIMSLNMWLCIGLIIAVFGTYGDLVESMLKRNMNTKDSGNAIPGHGGVLDRFDGFILALPFIAAFMQLCVD